jgi:hypothetical protein
MSGEGTLTERWEHGSDFDYPTAGTADSAPRPVDGGSYWHSGRDALRALVAMHPTRFSRVFFPSFYCQDVPVALQADGVPVLVYADAPDALEQGMDVGGLRAGDAVVASNTLGLRAQSPLSAPLPEGVTLVEDHTHAPFSSWAASSRAHFAFASLRKWLPVPDGARLWSPAGLRVPDAPALDAQHAAVTLRRLSGMLLKSRYLAGEAVDKPAFRELLVDGEHQIGQGAPGAMSPMSRALVDVLPTRSYLATRLANFEEARDHLQGIPGLAVLSPNGVGAVPFAVTLMLGTGELRDALRAGLAAERIYGAVLWPIDATRVQGVPDAHAALSSRVLSLHCDHRYSKKDMERVASAVRRLASRAA